MRRLRWSGSNTLTQPVMDGHDLPSSGLPLVGARTPNSEFHHPSWRNEESHQRVRLPSAVLVNEFLQPMWRPSAPTFCGLCDRPAESTRACGTVKFLDRPSSDIPLRTSPGCSESQRPSSQTIRAFPSSPVPVRFSSRDDDLLCLRIVRCSASCVFAKPSSILCRGHRSSAIESSPPKSPGSRQSFKESTADAGRRCSFEETRG